PSTRQRYPLSLHDALPICRLPEAPECSGSNELSRHPRTRLTPRDRSPNLFGTKRTGGAAMAKVAGVTVDTDHWIGGERVGSAAAFTDLSPIDERPVAEVARGGAAEAEAAVAAAARAFPAWSRTSREERARILHAIADGVDKRLEELAQDRKGG